MADLSLAGRVRSISCTYNISLAIELAYKSFQSKRSRHYRNYCLKGVYLMNIIEL